MSRLVVRILGIRTGLLLLLIGVTITIIVSVSYVRGTVTISITLDGHSDSLGSNNLAILILYRHLNRNITGLLILTPIGKLLRSTSDLSILTNGQFLRQTLSLN